MALDAAQFSGQARSSTPVPPAAVSENVTGTNTTSMRQVQDRNAELLAILQHNTAQNTELQRRLVEATTKLDGSNKAGRALQAERNQLAAEMYNIKKTQSELEQQLKVSRDECQRLQKDLLALRGTENTADSSLVREIERVRQELTARNAVITELRDKLRKLQQDQLSASSSPSRGSTQQPTDVEVLRLMVEQLQDDVKAKSEDSDTLRREVVDLQLQRDISTRNLAARKTSVDGDAVAVEQLTREQARSKAIQQELHLSKSELMRVQADMRVLNDTLADVHRQLEHERQSATAASQRLTEARSEIKRLKEHAPTETFTTRDSQTQNLTAILAEDKARLSAAQAEVNQLKQSVAELKRQQQDARVAQSDAENKLQVARSRIDILEAEAKELTSLLRQSDERLMQSAKTVKQLQATIHELDSQAQHKTHATDHQAVTSRQKYQEFAMEYEAIIQQLTSLAEQSHAETEKLQKHLVEVEAAAEATQARLRTELAHTQREHGVAATKFSHTQQQLSDAGRERDKLAEDAKDLQRNVSRLEQESISLKHTLAEERRIMHDLRLQLSNAEGQGSQHDNEISELRFKLQRVIDEKNALKLAYEELDKKRSVHTQLQGDREALRTSLMEVESLLDDERRRVMELNAMAADASSTLGWLHSQLVSVALSSEAIVAQLPSSARAEHASPNRSHAHAFKTATHQMPEMDDFVPILQTVVSSMHIISKTSSFMSREYDDLQQLSTEQADHITALQHELSSTLAQHQQIQLRLLKADDEEGRRLARLESDVKVLNTEKAGLVSEIAVLQARLTEITTDYEAAMQQHSNDKLTILNLQRRLEMSSESLQALSSEAGRLLQQKTHEDRRLQSRLSDAMGEADTLRHMYHSAEHDKLQAVEELENTREALAALRRTVADMDADNDRNQRQFRQLKNELAIKSSVNTALRSQTAELVLQLEARVQQYKDTRARLERQMHLSNTCDRDNTVHQLKSCLGSLKQELSQLNASLMAQDTVIDHIKRTSSNPPSPVPWSTDRSATPVHGEHMKAVKAKLKQLAANKTKLQDASRKLYAQKRQSGRGNSPMLVTGGRMSVDDITHQQQQLQIQQEYDARTAIRSGTATHNASFESTSTTHTRADSTPMRPPLLMTATSADMTEAPYSSGTLGAAQEQLERSKSQLQALQSRYLKQSAASVFSPIKPKQ